MSLLMLSDLAEGAMAQASAYYNSAAFVEGATCDFGSTDVMDPAMTENGSGEVMYLLTFADGTNPQVALDAQGFSDLQVFSSNVYQALLPDSSLLEDATFRADNQLTAWEVLPNAVKLSRAVHGLVSGEALLASHNTELPTQILAQTTGSEPDLDAIVNAWTAIPECFGVDSTIADLVSAGTGATSEISDTNLVTYTFDPSPDNATVALYMTMLANEPDVLYVEPVLAAVTMASANTLNGGAALSVTPGDAKEVAEGFGVSGSCNYMQDRGFDGRGEVVAVVDDGLLADSTFFYDPDDTILPCYETTGVPSTCCAFTKPDGCTSYSSECDASCVEITDTEGANGTAINMANEARRILAYVPVADGMPAKHGTLVTSTIVGEALSARGISCPSSTEIDPSTAPGVASGATAIFVDVGKDGEDDLRIPTTSFGTVLQELAYNQGANTVVLAWGSNSNGAPDAVTRAIDSFVRANSDAVVVTAAGESDAGNSNTAQAKNGISVGVYGSSASSRDPTLSVQFLSSIDAGTMPDQFSGDTANFCGVDEFSGSSAGAAIVGGQVQLIEQYLKEEGQIFSFDSDGAETINQEYTGATIKALLVGAANTNGVEGNGFGVPSLDNVLPFEEEHQHDLRIEQHTVTEGMTITRDVVVTDDSSPLIVTLAYTDQAPAPFASSMGVVNDIRVTITTPTTLFYPEGVTLYPNGAADGSGPTTNAQKITVAVPETGTYTITVSTNFISTTSENDQQISLVVTGRFEIESTDSVTGQEAGEETSTPACCPYGTLLPTTSCFPISFLVLIVIVVAAAGLAVLLLFSARCKVKDTEAPH